MELEKLVEILRNGSEDDIKRLVGDIANMVVFEGIDVEVYPEADVDRESLMRYIDYTDYIKVFNKRIKKIVYMVFLW